MQERIHDVANNMILPSVLYKPQVFQDGERWCCLYGESIERGVHAFGANPSEAVSNFDYYAWYGKPTPIPAG